MSRNIKDIIFSLFEVLEGPSKEIHISANLINSTVYWDVDWHSVCPRLFSLKEMELGFFERKAIYNWARLRKDIILERTTAPKNKFNIFAHGRKFICFYRLPTWSQLYLASTCSKRSRHSMSESQNVSSGALVRLLQNAMILFLIQSGGWKFACCSMFGSNSPTPPLCYGGVLTGKKQIFANMKWSRCTRRSFGLLIT